MSKPLWNRDGSGDFPSPFFMPVFYNTCFFQHLDPFLQGNRLFPYRNDLPDRSSSVRQNDFLSLLHQFEQLAQIDLRLPDPYAHRSHDSSLLMARLIPVSHVVIVVTLPVAVKGSIECRNVHPVPTDPLTFLNHIPKVKVMLQIYRVTELCGN